MGQILSQQALIDKRARDLADAKTDKRRKRKAENQVERRKLAKKGFKLRNKDIHHGKDGKLTLVSVQANRGNFGNGTKKEQYG